MGFSRVTFAPPFGHSYYMEGPNVVLRHPGEDRFDEISNGADQMTLHLADIQCYRFGYPIRRPRNLVYDLSWRTEFLC